MILLGQHHLLASDQRLGPSTSVDGPQHQRGGAEPLVEFLGAGHQNESLRTVRQRTGMPLARDCAPGLQQGGQPLGLAFELRLFAVAQG